MSVGDRAAILAVGVALLVPGIAAIWKGASLRSDSLGSWQSRIATVVSGLNEKLVAELRKINAVTGEFLAGLEGQNFDPLQVIADPAALADPVGDFEKVLKTFV